MRHKFLCLDCRKDTGKMREFYMLIDSVWEQIHDSPHGMLCIGCAEARLGRRLTPADFNSSYVNDPFRFERSLRLNERLGHA